jgi:hypothetical protein
VKIVQNVTIVEISMFYLGCSIIVSYQTNKIYSIGLLIHDFGVDRRRRKVEGYEGSQSSLDSYKLGIYAGRKAI